MHQGKTVRFTRAIEIVFLITFRWHETNVLDNWQLVVLPHFGGTEFDRRWVHNNLSIISWVYMRFPVPKHYNLANKCPYKRIDVIIHIQKGTPDWLVN